MRIPIEKIKRKHYWLVIREEAIGYVVGCFLESKEQLKEYLSGGFPNKYEDREILPEEIMQALSNCISIRRKGKLIVIHYALFEIH